MTVERMNVEVPRPAAGRRVVVFEADRGLVAKLERRVAGDGREAERVGKRFEGLLKAIVDKGGDR